MADENETQVWRVVMADDSARSVRVEYDPIPYAHGDKFRLPGETPERALASCAAVHDWSPREFVPPGQPTRTELVAELARERAEHDHTCKALSAELQYLQERSHELTAAHDTLRAVARACTLPEDTAPAALPGAVEGCVRDLSDQIGALTCELTAVRAALREALPDASGAYAAEGATLVSLVGMLAARCAAAEREERAAHEDLRAVRDELDALRAIVGALPFCTACGATATVAAYAPGDSRRTECCDDHVLPNARTIAYPYADAVRAWRGAR